MARLSVRQRVLLFDGLASAFALAGLAGLIAHGVLLDSTTATWIAPQFLGLWLALFVLFHALQAFWSLHVGPFRGPKVAMALFLHYCLLTLVSFLLMIGYYVGYRVDGGTWALFLTPCLAMNASLSWNRLTLAKAMAQRGAKGAEAGEGGGNPGEGDLEATGLDQSLMVHPKTEQQNIGLLVAAGFNAFFISLAFVFLVFMLGGCFVQASGYRSYPPPGIFVTLTYPGGQQQKIMVYCTGERDPTRPTIIIDVGGGGHSSSDMYGMQFAFNEEGYRVCTYDYPGCGWSDNGVDVTQPQILHEILTAIEEPPPYLLIGTMDGAPTRIYDYALKHPENVRALVPIDYNPGPSEMETYKILRGYSDEEAMTYAIENIRGRYNFGNIIRGLAVQWGFMAMFVPARGTFVPADREMEKLFLNIYNEKQWHTQLVYLANQLAHPELLFTFDNWSTQRILDASIPVLWVYNNVDIARQCEEWHYTADQCEEAHAAKALSRSYIEQATNMTAGSMIIQYEDAKEMLSQGEYIDWTVQQILANI